MSRAAEAGVQARGPALAGVSEGVIMHGTAETAEVTTRPHRGHLEVGSGSFARLSSRPPIPLLPAHPSPVFPCTCVQPHGRQRAEQPAAQRDLLSQGRPLPQKPVWQKVSKLRERGRGCHQQLDAAVRLQISQPARPASASAAR